VEEDSGKDSAAEASPPPNCASLSPAPFFCDDFDANTDNGLWDPVHQTGGTVVVNSTEYISPFNSMLVTVNGNADPSTLEAEAFKSLPGGVMTGTCALGFALRIDAADTSSASSAVVAAIQLHGATTQWDLELEVYYSQTASAFTVGITEIPQEVVHPATVTFPLGTWVNALMTIALPPAPDGSATAKLTLNGSTALSATVHVLAGAQPTSSPTAVVGTNYATATSGGWALRYDNVTFDMK
jgi:hypothetical protein